MGAVGELDPARLGDNKLRLPFRRRLTDVGRHIEAPSHLVAHILLTGRSRCAADVDLLPNAQRVRVLDLRVRREEFRPSHVVSARDAVCRFASFDNVDLRRTRGIGEDFPCLVSNIDSHLGLIDALVILARGLFGLRRGATVLLSDGRLRRTTRCWFRSRVWFSLNRGLLLVIIS